MHDDNDWEDYSDVMSKCELCCTCQNDLHHVEDEDRAAIEVREHNGQCAYGPWISLDDEDLPPWVAEGVADQRAEDRSLASGRVTQGGAIYIWREEREMAR